MTKSAAPFAVPFHKRIERWRLLLGMLFVPVIAACALFVLHPFPEHGALDAALDASGWGLIAAGLGIRLWALGYISGRKNRVLVTAGPYRHTRNPLYFGSFLYGLGACMLCESLTAVLAFLAWFQFLYAAAMRAEEEHIASQFGEDFQRYQDSVPLFFPTLRPAIAAADSAFRLAKPFKETLALLFLVLAAWGVSEGMEHLHFSLNMPSLLS